MAISKEAKSLGISLEKDHMWGYSQAVKADNAIYVFGQVSHNDKDNIVEPRNMEMHMRKAYSNIEMVHL